MAGLKQANSSGTALTGVAAPPYTFEYYVWDATTLYFTTDLDVTGDLTLTGDLTVTGDFVFGDAVTDTMTVAGDIVYGASTADYLIDFNAATPATADIRFAAGATLINAADVLTIEEATVTITGGTAINLDGTTTVSGIIEMDAAVTQGLIISGATTEAIDITGNATTAINVDTGTFTTGIALAGTLTTGITIGAATSGIVISGATTQGLHISGNATDGILLDTGTFTDGISIGGTVTNSINFAATPTQFMYMLDDGTIANDTDTGGAVSLDKDDINGYFTVNIGGATRYVFLFDAIPSAI